MNNLNFNFMTKKLLLLLVCSMMTVYSFAQNSGTCGDNLVWFLDSSTETLTIRGSGEMIDYGIGGAPWFIFGVMGQIKQVVIEEGVANIGDCAFVSWSYRYYYSQQCESYRR